MKIVCVASCAFLVSASAVRAQTASCPEPTSVFVFAAVATPGSPTSEEAERIGMLERVKKSLPNNKRISDQVVVNDTREAAIIAVEIVSAEQQNQVSPTGSRIEIFVLPAYTLTAKLTFGSYSTDFTAHATEQPYKKIVNSGRFNTPSSLDGAIGDLIRIKAANDLSVQIRDWITTNLADIRKK